MQKNSFILYTDILPRVERLSREQAGDLFMAVLRFAVTDEVQVLDDPVTDIIYGFITDQIARDKEKFRKICQRRSENAKKRWAKQVHTATGDTETENETENVTETVTVNVNETDTVTVSVNENELPPPAQAPAPAPQGESPTPPHHTPHTPQQKEQSVQEMLSAAEVPSAYTVITVTSMLGFSWSMQEAERFLDYNKDRGRKDGWEFAIRKWEEQRSRHQNSPDDLSEQERQLMNDYLSVGNRLYEGII